MRSRLRWLADPMIHLVLAGGVIVIATTNSRSFGEGDSGQPDPGHAARCEVCRFSTPPPGRPDLGIGDNQAPLDGPVTLSD